MVRCLVPALLAFPSLGCLHVSRTPGGTDRVEVLDAAGVRVPEAWAVSWSETRSIPLGLFCWYPFGTLWGWPDLQGVCDVRLERITPREDRRTRPAEYEAFVYWGLLLLPPGSYCRSNWRSYLFAEGCPWGFDGDRWSSPDNRVLARARSAPQDGRLPGDADHVRATWIAPLFEAPDIPRQDLRDFARMLLQNIRSLGVRETAPPDVVRKLEALTR